MAQQHWINATKGESPHDIDNASKPRSSRLEEPSSRNQQNRIGEAECRGRGRPATKHGGDDDVEEGVGRQMPSKQLRVWAGKGERK